MPFSLWRLLLLIAAFVIFVTVVQLGALQIAFDKLGLAPQSAYLLLGVTLLGSPINLPLFSVKAEATAPDTLPRQWRELFGLPRHRFTGKTIVAINVGGCVVPVAFSAYLLAHNPISLFQLVVAIAAVAIVSFLTSYPMRGVGIAMPFLVAPVTAALVAIALDVEQPAPLAYIGGTLGVLIGADLMRIKQIGKLGAAVASIGGAGTFDGVFLSGLLAVLLA